MERSERDHVGVEGKDSKTPGELVVEGFMELVVVEPGKMLSLITHQRLIMEQLKN
jgi:hypothetical protein